MNPSEESPAPSQGKLLSDLISLLERNPEALQQLKQSLDAGPSVTPDGPSGISAVPHPEASPVPQKPLVPAPAPLAEIRSAVPPPGPAVVSHAVVKAPQAVLPPPGVNPVLVKSATEGTDSSPSGAGSAHPVAPAKRGIWEQIGGGSLTFAALFHLVLLSVGAFWIFQIIREPEKKVDFLPGGGSAGGGERSAQTKVQQKKRAQITPSTNVKRVFAEGATSNYAIPDPGDNFGEMSALSSLAGGGASGGLGGSGSGGGFGSGHGTGSGLGKGMGTGKLFGLIPETMRKRCSKDDRLQRLKENGGTPACEEAVLKGLRWLKANQQSDGSWGGDFKPAMTGLALLAYFGHCETPVSDEFGESCMRGIVYLVNLGMRNNGRMARNFSEGSWPYQHAIATYALGEATTFCKELKVDVPNLISVTEKAGQFIIDNQNMNGGWGYLYAKDVTSSTDLSVSGWQIQALKACSHTSIKFRGMSSCITKALKYTKECQHESGGFGYNATKGSAVVGYHSLTGVGMLCNQMWDKGNRAEVRKAAKYVLENTRFDYNTEFSDLYGHYYESQAMMQRGGEDWKRYNALFRDQLLNNQEADGSWRPPGGGRPIRGAAPEYFADPLYRTCLCTLMLEVYYRFLSTGEVSRHVGI